MRCEFKKMGHDVVKSIMLKNIVNGAILVFTGVIISVLILMALDAGLNLLEYRTSADVQRMIDILLGGLMLVVLGRAFYSWYNKSKRWCDNRGKDDV